MPRHSTRFEWSFFCRGNSLQYIEAFNAFRVCVLRASNVPQYIEAFNAFWVEFFFSASKMLQYIEAFNAFWVEAFL